MKDDQAPKPRPVRRSRPRPMVAVSLYTDAEGRTMLHYEVNGGKIKDAVVKKVAGLSRGMLGDLLTGLFGPSEE